jgi:hypothetical protein
MANLTETYIVHKTKLKTLWPESASELYGTSECRLLTKFGDIETYSVYIGK